MVFVVKRDGRREEFDRRKIIRTCIRAGASREIAEKIAKEVEKRVYDGMSTEKILELVLSLLETYAFSSAARYDLKMALLRLGPAGYEFEKFVARLLKEYGYKTETNALVHGKCAEHEIDVIAKKGERIYMIECKFHNLPGIYTGLKEVLYTYARFLDLKEGFEEGKHEFDFAFPWLFTNTKFSQDAKKFAVCRNILLTGWRYPRSESIEKLLERKGLYPVTVLRNLRKREEEILINSGYVFCRDLLAVGMEEISGKTGIGMNTLKKLVEESREVVRGNG